MAAILSMCRVGPGHHAAAMCTGSTTNQGAVRWRYPVVTAGVDLLADLEIIDVSVIRFHATGAHVSCAEQVRSLRQFIAHQSNFSSGAFPGVERPNHHFISQVVRQNQILD